MLRKLAGGLLGSSSSENHKIRALTALGFDTLQSRNALEATNGNVEQAAELLLSSSAPTTTTTTTVTPPSPPQETDMERAIRLSLEENPKPQGSSSSSSSSKKNPSVSNRLSSTSTNTPQKPKKLSNARAKATPNRTARQLSEVRKEHQKRHEADSQSSTSLTSWSSSSSPLNSSSTEERLSRLASRLNGESLAVDTLLRTLTALRSHPHDTKFRNIDTTTTGYAASLEPVPAARDYLLAVGYKPQTKGGTTQQHQHSQHLTMDRPPDDALVWTAMQFLQRAKETPKYVEDKRRRLFDAEVERILSSDSGMTTTEAELSARLDHSVRLPREPQDGRGSLLAVRLNRHRTIRRRFEADDTLGDVLEWLGTQSSVLPSKLSAPQHEWVLVDANVSKGSTLSNDSGIVVVSRRPKEVTLQALGCWPSGLLELRDGTTVAHNDDNLVSARGLGL